ncbi:Retrovirus-related Pol polyprotein from transposon TNT 1-94 [Linum perenne]
MCSLLTKPLNQHYHYSICRFLPSFIYFHPPLFSSSSSSSPPPALRFGFSSFYRHSGSWAATSVPSTTLMEVVKSVYNQGGERIAIRADHKSFSYAQLVSSASEISTLLCGAGLKPIDGARGNGPLAGARIGIVAKPCVEFVAGVLATWFSGGVAVPLAVSYPETELLHVMNDSGISMVLSTEDYHEVMEKVASKCAAQFSLLPSVANISSETSAYDQKIFGGIDALKGDDPALIIYTSGTTGKPKGALHTHNSVNSQVQILAEAWEYTSNDQFLHCLPLHHVHGLFNALFAPLYAGSTVEFMPKFSVKGAWQRWRESYPESGTKSKDAITAFTGDLSSGKMIGKARLRDGLYYLDMVRDPTDEKQLGLACRNSNPVTEEIMLLHSRLGHPNFHYLKQLFPSLFLNVRLSEFQCEACVFAKTHRNKYPARSYSPSHPFYLIHSDVWGPSKIPTLHGNRWFVSFIDDHTRLGWVYLLKHKSDVKNAFCEFYTMISTQFQTGISILRFDNGTEYFNTQLGSFLKDKGIVHQSSCRSTPQQNGIAERRNRHLLEVTRALMFSANLPKYLWGEALLTAAYLINRVPSKPLQFQTPLQCLSKTFPHNRLQNNLPLKVFGSVCYVLTPSQFQSKLDPKSKKCVFIGYASNQKGYKYFDPLTQKTQVSKDVSFWETTPYFSKNSLQGEILPTDNPSFQTEEVNFWEVLPPTFPLNMSSPIETETAVQNEPGGSSSDVFLGADHSQKGSISDLGESVTGGDLQEKVSNDTVREVQVYSRRSRNLTVDKEPTQSPAVPIIASNDGHQTTLPHTPQPNPNSGSTLEPSELPIALRKSERSCARYHIGKYVSYAKLSNPYKAYVSKVSNLFVPRNVKEALDNVMWTAAVQEEMKALVKNDTWTMVDLPPGKSTVGCKWVFTIKCNADGSVERYKARLVARGFTQTYGIDYMETFAPVAKMNSIRILLSVAVNLDWPLYQLDVKNAFLNGKLEEEVYMAPPPGFEKRLGEGKVCKLQKSLYGLKQSPRAWFERFGRAIKEFGFYQSQADHTLFFKHLPHGRIIVLIVYVDDIIITGNDPKEIKLIKQKLGAQFEIKDLGNLKFFLGMEFARSKDKLFVNQRKYVIDLLEETGMMDCRPVDTPMDANLKLRVCAKEEVKNQERYQRLVGKLIYLAHTRPDIAFAVSVVSQFMHAPGAAHFDAVYRIIRYLKGAPGKGLMFTRHGNLNVEAYTDADWAGDVNDRRSTSGYCTFVGGNLVTWRSKKQSVVARSSAEAEFRALALGVCEVTWISRILKELRLSISKPIRIYSDSKAAVAIAHNPVLHDRTKHVEVDKHFIKEKIDGGEVCLPYISTTDQIADILTKGLYKSQFNYLVSKLAMDDIFAPA